MTRQDDEHRHGDAELRAYGARLPRSARLALPRQGRMVPALGRPGAAVDAEVLSTFGAQAVASLRAGFDRSPHPMLIADDERRWVTGNAAASALLGIPRDEIPWRTMDEFTPPSGLSELERQWSAFLTTGAAEGWYQLYVPNRGSIPVEFSAIANVLPARHLTVFVLPEHAGAGDTEVAAADAAAWAAVVAGTSVRAQLTNREREVMTLIASGGRNDDIAARLFLSPETVKTHVQNAMVKLGAHTRAHAVALALVTGMITWSTDELTAPGSAPDDRTA
jgi:DNA-binding CsgD family transcriptional regulator